MTRNELHSEILARIQNGTISDRFLTRAEDGHPYFTDTKLREPQVKIPTSDSVGITEDEESESAWEYVAQAESELEVITE